MFPAEETHLEKLVNDRYRQTMFAITGLAAILVLLVVGRLSRHLMYVQAGLIRG